MVSFLVRSFVIVVLSIYAMSAQAQTSVSASGGLPRTYLLDPAIVEGVHASLQTENGSKQYRLALKALKNAAEKALAVRPEAVVEKKLVPPSGDKHDYMSMGKYWWPNPESKDGLPYIRRDGEVNPEAQASSDEAALNKMIKTVVMLSYASYYLGDERSADGAVAYLRVWFLDPATRMNPNLTYAQAVPGRNDGRGSGIIDAHQLVELVDALGMLEYSNAFTAEDRRGISAWFKEYLTWLRESKNGRQEAAARNNHGTWYDVQVVSIALYTGNDALAKDVLEQSRLKRISAQIQPDGTQPEELARTRSFGYSLFNLKALSNLALLGERAGIDLWNYETKDGRGIRKVLDQLLPFISGQAKWTGPQIGEVKLGDMFALLTHASRVYKDPKYAAAAATLPDAKKLSVYSSLLLGIQ